MRVESALQVHTHRDAVPLSAEAECMLSGKIEQKEQFRY